MKKYTLTSYDPVELDLPKPQVPASLVDAQIEKLLEPMAEYHEIAEERGVAMGDHVVVTTVDARLDGNPASNFVLEHSLYHVGGGEMPRTFDEELGAWCRARRRTPRRRSSCRWRRTATPPA